MIQCEASVMGVSIRGRWSVARPRHYVSAIITCHLSLQTLQHSAEQMVTPNISVMWCLVCSKKPRIF